MSLLVLLLVVLVLLLVLDETLVDYDLVPVLLHLSLVLQTLLHVLDMLGLLLLRLDLLLELIGQASVVLVSLLLLHLLQSVFHFQRVQMGLLLHVQFNHFSVLLMVLNLLLELIQSQLDVPLLQFVDHLLLPLFLPRLKEFHQICLE